MHAKVDAVIFDCDGTLVDSEHIGNRVLAELISAQGRPLTPDEAVARFRGMKLSECLSQIEAELGRPLPETFVPDFRRRTAAAFRASLRAMPGAKALIESIGVPVCVASSGPREKIELSLSITGLLPYFAGRIFSSYEVGSWKPEPGLFLHAAAAVAVAPSRCAVIEDSLPGIQAGLAAGMLVFAFQPSEVDPRLPVGVPVVRDLRQLHALLPQAALTSGSRADVSAFGGAAPLT